MITPLTSAQKQSRRIAELDAIAQAAGWQTWTQYATAVKRGVVSIAANPAANRANPLTRAGSRRGGRVKKQSQGDISMNGKKAWKLDVYQVVEGTDDWPLIDTVYGATKEECEDAAEMKYGSNADDKHWTGADLNN